MTLLVLGIGIADAAKIHLTQTMLQQPVYRLLNLILIKIPEPRKIVHDTIGNHTQGNLVAHTLLLHHQAVDGIVEGGVTTYHDEGLIAIGNHHLGESLYTIGRLTLHHIIGYMALI